MAHLLKHGGGICSIDISEDQFEVEKFCNKFAAEFLVPSEDLITKLKNRTLSDREISELAEQYGVSVQVMMLRLLDSGLIARERYFEFKNKFDESKLRKKGGKRDWEKTFYNRIGKIALSEISKAYKSGEISFFEAVKILNINTKYAERLLG